MSLLKRIREFGMPRPGEFVEVYQKRQLIAAGTVVAVDRATVTIAEARGGLVDLDTDMLRSGLRDGSISIQRPRDFSP